MIRRILLDVSTFGTAIVVIVASFVVTAPDEQTIVVTSPRTPAAAEVAPAGEAGAEVADDLS